MALTIRGAINPTSVSVPTSHLAEILEGGGEPTDSFTVTKNLTHAVIKNERISGSSYYAEVEPAENWSDLTVTIKVGGVDMSNLYTSGVINIPNVTGNIVITAAAAQAALVSITAVYTQSGTVYDTDSLDSLKSDLVVTANYADSSTATVTDYTLSGTLAEGTSTVTVSYGGKTAQFNVTISKLTFIEWDYTDGDNGKVYGHTMNNGSVTFESDGVHLNSGNVTAWFDVAQLRVNVPSSVNLANKILTVEVDYINSVTPNDNGSVVFFPGSPDYTPRFGRSSTKTIARLASSPTTLVNISTQWGTWDNASGNFKIVFNPSTYMFTLYKNGTQVYSSNTANVTATEYDHDYSAGTIAEVQRGDRSGEFKVTITRVRYSWEDITS